MDTAVPDTGIITKLTVLSDAERSVDDFAGFYRRILPPTVVNNLAGDLRWPVETARETIITL
ncbi:MAG: hypothetical protein QXV97_04935 [Candidatus Caldarchaeum sp.]